MTAGLAYIREHLELDAVGHGQWVAVCPCHEDTEPSLCITLRPDQDRRWKLWFHCKVCDANGSAVCAATGMKPVRALWPTDDDRAGMQRPKRSLPLPSPAEINRWCRLLGRRGHKMSWLNFLTHWRGFPYEGVVWDHQIGWNGQAFTLPVYRQGRGPGDVGPDDMRLANLLRCEPHGRPALWPGTHHALYPDVPRWQGFVIVCEGVWDALMGRAYNLPSVTGTGGAGYWNDEWSRRFRGLRVFVVYDCDKAGRTGAQKVKASIPHATVLDLAPRRYRGWDLSDHLRQHSNTDRLMEMISAGGRKRKHR